MILAKDNSIGLEIHYQYFPLKNNKLKAIDRVYFNIETPIICCNISFKKRNFYIFVSFLKALNQALLYKESLWQNKNV
jgi:hypothetical protein